ncbi:peptide chain release factor 2 [Candidatus Phytoplasma pini]|uniref:Peptide chain release factor 2 n=1 Tax=Candidatus Phytoplasma pini TaxID=267362 RepID=A0A559KJC6_9MOLU|nr:peptide chain release factor 2 [Candidatus Phytoplasma pini]TVY12235.1 Peptide chain release factor 2 [Candidatus Phytoplasma pini]
MERYEINNILANLTTSLITIEKKINISEKQKEISKLIKMMEDYSFWKGNVNSINLAQELHKLQEKVKLFLDFKKKIEDLVFLFDLSEDNSPDFFLLIKDLKQVVKELKNFEIETLLNQTYDQNNAILILHSGAGGTESQDWCEILFRMYQRYSQRKNFKIQILYLNQGEEAGIKTVSLLIQGFYAYGYLKSEKGVHRLVRISPFDSNSKRHTSFVSCEVLPEINEDIKIDIKDEDIRIDVFRSSGAGGQHVNTTDSAVRITHFPTGIVVNCQNERSQIKNREQALRILKTKLLQLAIEKKKENENITKEEQKDISWGHQIRSYIFHPYQMVKDHRTNCEIFQIDLVMDGYLDNFINAFLKQQNN